MEETVRDRVGCGNREARLSVGLKLFLGARRFKDFVVELKKNRVSLEENRIGVLEKILWKFLIIFQWFTFNSTIIFYLACDTLLEESSFSFSNRHFFSHTPFCTKKLCTISFLSDRNIRIRFSFYSFTFPFFTAQFLKLALSLSLSLFSISRAILASRFKLSSLYFIQSLYSPVLFSSIRLISNLKKYEKMPASPSIDVSARITSPSNDPIRADFLENRTHSRPLQVRTCTRLSRLAIVSVRFDRESS